MSPNNRLICGCIATAAGFAAQHASSQEAAVSGTPVLEEIVVTSQRREESLQEVPISVTAFTAETLERAGINSASGYLALTPNVSFSEDAGVGSRGVNISIRGVNDLKSGENSVITSIGVYLDEFSVVSFPTGTVNPQLADLERVEVLRGPQGTYFGRNSVGGALNLTTRKPSNVLEGRVEVRALGYEGAGEQGSMSAMLNVPIADGFYTRGVLYYENSSGKVENINPAGVDSGHEYLMGRIAARWEPSSATTVDLMLMHSDERQDGDETVPSGVWNVDTVDGYNLGVSNLTRAVDPGTGFWPQNQNKNSHDLDEYSDVKATTAILNLTHRVSDTLTVKAIAGVIDGEIDRLFDNDLVGNYDSFFRENTGEGTSYSGELRLELDTDSVTWVNGVLYAKDDQTRSSNVVAGTEPAKPIGIDGPDPDGVVLLPPLPYGLCFLCDRKSFQLESVAVFSDLTWKATDALNVILGARYTRDDVSTEQVLFGPTFLDPVEINRARGEQTFDDITPRAGVRYAFSDTISGYVTASKGYKAGGTSVGFNPDPVNVPLPAVIAEPFREETLWNYELGLKTEWWDRRLRVNGSVFFLDWSDLQLEVFRFLVPGNLQSKFALTSNVDSAEGKGAELELAVALTDGFSLSAGFGYLDTEITRSAPQELSGGFVVDLTGLSVPKSPRFTANLTAEYRWQTAAGDAYVRGDFIHRDGQYSNVEALVWEQTRGRFVPNRGTGAFLPATPGGFPFLTPDYDVVNVAAGYRWGNIEASLFVENLFEEKYFTGTAEDFSLSGIRLDPHPRVYGVSATYRFGNP